MRSSAQSAIFQEGSAHHYFLEYNLRPGWTAAALTDAVRPLLDTGSSAIHVLLAFGRDAWQCLAPSMMPEHFFSFHPILGRNDRVAPGTQADLLFWIHGDRHDLNFQHACRINEALKQIATLELELHGFIYLDSRDLTGFIDGTENPRGSEARVSATIPDGMPGAGGSFVLTQRWVHDLAAFSKLDVREQENVIGRTKADSVELEDAPPTAHVRRAEISIDDVPLEIYRRSTPYGTTREMGLYFLAFSRDQMVFATQLDRMFGLSEDGLMDRLTEFSTPVSGSYFFAPSCEALRTVFGADTQPS